MKRVLLTGASGFIGSHCMEPLRERGFEVHAVSGQDRPPSLPGVTWHTCDLLARDAAETLVAAVRPTHLLHLAWYVVPGKLITSEMNFAWVAASMELVKSFARHGGTRLLCAGSGYEYDWSYGYCGEKRTPAAPDTIYGACKLALHLLVDSFSQSAGLSSAWGRVFFLYGPREHRQRLVSSVVLSLLAAEPAKCSHGRQIRDYLHVQDVADGLVATLDSTVTGAINVSSGQATTLRDIVSTIGRQLGRPELIQLGAIAARANDAALVVGENSRLVAETGWKQRHDLESGIAQTIDWWRTQER
jgi:nucleoside-diphosphate-sugar epimerase